MIETGEAQQEGPSPGRPGAQATAGFVLLQWTPDGRIDAAGDATLLGGLPESEAALRAALAPASQRPLIEALQRVRAGDAAFHVACCNVAGLQLELRGGMLHDARGTRLVVVVNAARIDALASQCARLQHEAATTRADFDLFAHTVSHDLRAPLRAIGGFSEVLLEAEPGALEDSARQYLPRIVAATHRMAQLLDDLLGFARAGRAEMNPQAVDLVVLAHEAIARVRVRRPDHVVEAVLPESAPAWGDPALLRMALEQLFDNAWKATAQCAAARVELRCRSEGVLLRCAVCDNGLGFDAAYADRLFQPLQRLHRASDFEGSGVGLAIMRRIVERHGGSVRAEGRPGAGACFGFDLPGEPPAAQV